MDNVYVVWHFTPSEFGGQLQGIFTTEQAAQEACVEGDCYQEIKLNYLYEEDFEASDYALYKQGNQFLPFEKYVNSL